jgi:hypothetical protein
MLEPDSPRHIRVKQLFLWARQIVRARGICSLQGIEANIGALTIHLSALGPHSEGARKQGSAPRLPYRLDIWRRKKMVLSVDYDAGRQIEATFFAPGVWEYEVEWLAKQSPASPAASNTAA